MTEPTRTAPDTRWLGTITVEVEVACDGNPDHLAADMSTLVERALEERGADLGVSFCWARDIGGSPAGTNAVERQIADLRAEIAALRASLAAEVRTRRLVVEEEDGFDRIVAEGRGSHGTVVVHARPVDHERAAEGAVEGEDASVVLVGSDESIAASAGVYAMAGGHSFGGLMVHGRSVAPKAAEGPYASINLDSPLMLPGILIDSEGVKNAPMRLYMEREQATA